MPDLYFQADRVEIIPVQLNKSELDALAKRTRLIINCVGPYHLYSTPVVEACAENGTHYVDVSVNFSTFVICQGLSDMKL